MKTKSKIVHLPNTTQNAYIKTVLGQHPKKLPNDFVEVLIQEKKKELMNAKKTKV
jgi:hypothetical protein|tara:strand:+ start:2008 stop:2172 length:165 start_codon:yes stop_codon:yes gene_type:complete